MLEHSDDLALPKGSLILVTGASGYIASNFIVEALDAGYKIRGTARSAEKAEKTKKIFNSANYDAVVVPEMESEGAFDDAVKGVDAIVHMSSPLNFSPNPKEVVPPAVKGATSILRSAVKEPKIKRFVFTSSSTSTSLPTPGKKFKIDKNTWNTEIEDWVDPPPPYLAENAFKVYAASKTKAELAVWDFVKAEKPSFVVNFVLPSVNMGRVIDSPGETGGLVCKAFKGDVNWDFYPQYMVDVVDCARLHLIALLDKSLKNERILAFNVPFNFNVILDSFRALFPDRTFVENQEQGEDLSEVDNALGAALLGKWYGQEGYTPMVKSLEQNVQKLL
ncbi:unnamed protein product [Clonostachys rosea]|uniref:NAD-dependent epimerase/dehydratase domain-containing protein n=1 Tax=Bionectria ochroleuca TaxID=29856 RepID=A0ABY6UJR1_BIOOC|nr:unnamed protein product [Clonostachys rosea]